jgi:hypothetical protein
MDGDKTVTLSFGMQAYPLSLAKQGAGDGQVAVNGEAHALPFLGVFAYGSAVTVEAIPTTGSAFDRWTGDTTSDARAATVLVTGPSTVGVSFTNLTMHVLPVAPVTAGAPITLEAVAGDDAAHNYKFWAKRSSDSKFTLVRDWAADATCTIWHPVAGAYQLIVQASQPGGKYMESKRIAYTVATALSSLTLGGSPASPTAVDQAVSLLAAATGGLDVEYGFTAQRSGDLTPAFVRDFTLGRRNTIWAPTVAGTYTVTVIARERGTDATRTASLTYVVNPKLSALSLALTSPPSGPTALGVPIGLLATPTGGGTLEYQFLWNYSATTELAATWTKEAYGNGRGYTLKPTQPGFYTFRAYAREKGSTANYQASSADVKVEVKAAVSAYTVTFTPSGSGTVGGPITIAATGIVGGAQPQWKFWARKKGTSTWLLVRDYAAAPVVTDWKPANAGTYDVMVYCREVGSKAPTFDKCATATYVVR